MTEPRYGKVLSTIWNDPDFTSLRMPEQYLYLLLLSQNELNSAGVIPKKIAKWSAMADFGQERGIRKALSKLIDTGFVVPDEHPNRHSGELWIRSYLKYNNFMRNQNTLTAMVKSFNYIDSPKLQECVLDFFRQSFPQGFAQYVLETFDKGYPQGFDDPFWKRLGQPLPQSTAQYHRSKIKDLRSQIKGIDQTLDLGLHDGGGDRVDDDDDFSKSENQDQNQNQDLDRRQEFLVLVESAIDRIARDRMKLSPSSVVNPQAWLKTVKNQLAKDLEGRIFEASRRSFASLDALVEFLMPASQAGTSGYVDQVQVAQKELAQRDRSCEICSGSYYFLDEAGNAIPCPECNQAQIDSKGSVSLTEVVKKA